MGVAQSDHCPLQPLDASRQLAEPLLGCILAHKISFLLTKFATFSRVEMNIEKIASEVIQLTACTLVNTFKLIKHLFGMSKVFPKFEIHY